MQFGVCSYPYEALQMFVIGVRDKHMKMAKNVDGFRLPFGGNFKRGVPLLMGV